jgi:ribosome recycling factor
MPVQGILNAAQGKMQKAIDNVVNEFHTVRTGRANALLLEPIRVDYYGSPTPLKQVANLSVPEARMIVIQPWDPSSLEAIEKALQESNIGITPQNDGKSIRLIMPQPTAERRQELIKVVKRIAEEGRVSLRNIRREAKDALSKSQDDSGVSEDDVHRAQEKLQKLTDSSSSEIEKHLIEKEKEIETV